MSVRELSTRVAVAVALLGFTAVAVTGAVSIGNGIERLQGANTVAAGPDSLDDGPHVYWRTSSDAFVFYLCNGEVGVRRYKVDGSVSFKGFCADTAVEYVIQSRRPKVEPDRYKNVSKIFAISDVEGQYNDVVSLLQAAGIVDEAVNWSWGDGHLVVLGDIFDRGDKVTETLWLFHRLEREARESKGRVHVILGNHEMMALRNDLRYVDSTYFKGIVDAVGVSYSDLFGPDMELGRWLRSKHTVIKLNDLLFVHGGMPPKVAERGTSLKELNELTRKNIDSRSYVMVFDPEVGNHFGHTDEGLFWYRGYHRAQPDRYPKVTTEQLDMILDTYDVSTIIVGHTGLSRIESLFEGRVIGIDVPLDELGSFQGFLWEDGQQWRVLGDGSKEELLPVP